MVASEALTSDGLSPFTFEDAFSLDVVDYLGLRGFENSGSSGPSSSFSSPSFSFANFGGNSDLTGTKALWSTL